MTDILMAETVAREYWRTNSARKYGNTRELVDLIDRYMASRGLAASSISRIDIAHYVIQLQHQQAVAEAEAEAAFQQNIQSGWGPESDAELALAQQIKNTPIDKWGEARVRRGVAGPSVLAFLAGE
jgi:hypothetical protein